MKLQETQLNIYIENSPDIGSCLSEARLDGNSLPLIDGEVQVELNGGNKNLYLIYYQSPGSPE